MAEEKDPLAGYVQTLLELRDRAPEHPMDEASLKAIARDLGLDEGDWARLEKTFNRHMRIGSGFARLGNWTDAAAELEQALKLKPAAAEAQYRLAAALAGRWKQGGDPTDRERAEALARSVLGADPDHEGALRLVGELRTPASAPPSSSKRRTLALVLVGLLILLGMAATYLVFMPVEPAPTGDHRPQTEKAAPAETPMEISSGMESSTETVAASEPAQAPVQADLPIRWPEREALQFQTESSRYRPFTDSYSYQLKAILRPRGVEITGLTVRVALRDGAGEPIFQRTADVVADHHPPVWPGDVIPLGATLFQQTAPPIPGDAGVEILALDQRPARADYPELPTVALTWAGGKPPGVDIRVARRQSRFSDGSVAGKRFHRLELGVENVGSVGLKSLKFEIAWKNKAGEKLEARAFYAATTFDPLFAPGQRRAAGGTFGVPAEDGEPEWALSVVDAAF
ncbi:MAG: tetratricopeptide repeat protein [Desulfococcaceae bacterium]